jgi:hypothetical protein
MSKVRSLVRSCALAPYVVEGKESPICGCGMLYVVEDKESAVYLFENELRALKRNYVQRNARVRNMG